MHLVTGRVGSGKSSLSRLLAGLEHPDAGIVRAEGISRTMLSMQFPEYHVTAPTVTGEIRSWGLSPDVILHETGLAGRENDHPLHLSRGELKRLHLACVLATQYDVLILDEPFSALDCIRKERLCRRLETAGNGITIILTHEPLWLPKTDMLWEMDAGTLRSLGRIPEALLSWADAPRPIRTVIDRGNLPRNITPADIREARCRTRG
ncbi:MAG: energy-coupling factor ABC transporter ATP-binding protein [Methanomicrobiaceae archaeon]|nr:energy-coupling factor ABC transporter ATP-binding protein [Methanomicrobiaceae archaeon]